MPQRRLVLVAALLCLIVFVAADPPPNDPRAVGEEALKDRDWEKAEASLTEALAAAKEKQDEILYLLATAQQHAKKYDAAIGTLDRLVREHATSVLRMKALYKKGDVLAAKKEFALAARIYDEQVAAVTAAERRARIAKVYVEAGREFLKPKDEKDPTFVANYQAARNLLVKAMEMEALGADEEGVRADAIVCEQRGGMDRNLLLKSCREYLEKFPKGARLDEVLFARATGMRDTGRWHEARKDWERVATEFASSKLAAEGLYLAALQHVNEQGASGSLEELRRALPLLRRVAKDFASTEWGPKAGYLAGLALAHYEELRDDARRDLAAFADASAKDERAPEALLRVAQLWRADMDDAKAIATFEDFLKRFPDSPRWPEVRQAIADVRWEASERAFARKDWAAARTAAQEFGSLHPTDGRAAAAAYRIGEAWGQEKKWKEAAEAWLKAASKFPAYDEGQRARLEAAKALANELDDFETALKELAKVGGRWHGEAQQFAKTLQEKSLGLACEKVFTGADAPVVKLTVRNVETVKFRYWTLDLKDYFEKKAATTGLEALEVAVIAPDKEWDVPVKDYRRFKLMKLDVELPKRDPGAYVVWASIGAQEAKTVVVVSDLAMIARAGRHGAAVMVQNMRTGAEVPGAAVRMAGDGRHIRAWGEEIRPASVSLLAESGGHLAFRDLDVSRAAVPPKRVPAALVLAERLIVEPGEDVRLRFVIRTESDGAYAAPKDKAYTLRVLSAQGAMFHESPLTLSKFGTAQAAFRALKGLSGAMSVQVWEGTKPQEKLIGGLKMLLAGRDARRAQFVFLHDERPRFLGEDVDVTAVLVDAWGRPMPGRTVKATFSGDIEPRELLTDERGAVALQLRETDRFFREGAARVALQAESAHDTLVVPFLSRVPVLAFEAESRVTEPVVAGDQKAIVFSAKKADDAPFEGTFRWEIVRTNEAGQRLPVAQGDATTDREGKGRFAFVANEGGIHTVTVSLRDADGIPARVLTAVQVVDDKEERKLRLLSVADEFEPGKAMEFTVLSRLEKGLAFVTLESERVEQVVPVTVDKGRTKVTLNAPSGATHDFSVTVMMMQGDKFHTDARDFRVKMPEVKVEPAKKEVRPGEEFEVRVTAKPGSEVWLVAAPEVADELNPTAFTPSRPGPHFHGDSSAGTAYAWGTQQISQELLDALADLETLNEKNAGVMLERQLDRLKEKAAKEVADAEGIGGGGGGGGRYGGRLGGKKHLVARGGGGTGKHEAFAQPAPVAFASAEAGADGVAAFKLRAPERQDEIELVAWSVDASNPIGAGRAEVKVRGTVVAEVRFPESVVSGEKTTAVALLTNHSAAETEATVALNGAETKVKVPARSILEKNLDWTGAATASWSLDGVPHEVAVALRSRAPAGTATAGGPLAAKTTLALEGDGPQRMRVATGPAALLESLGEPFGLADDDWTRASDAAARLIARIARHRFERTDDTARFVREFAALRAAGLRDAAEGDIAWPVLMYVAAAEAKSAELEIAEPDPSVLKARFAQATSDDAKALILFALSRGGHAEYGFLHRLVRASNGLPPRALACVALALKAARKDDEAKAALDLLVKAANDDHWESKPGTQPDSAATDFAATALGAFAIGEIDPANPLLPRARAYLLSRLPRTAFERAAASLAMQSTPDRSQVTELKVDGTSVKGWAEMIVTKGEVEPTGAGTFYALTWRDRGPAPEPTVKTTIKRTARWPALVVEGRIAGGANAAVQEPVENPSMARTAAGSGFAVEYEIAVSGPTTQYATLELPRATGLRSATGSHRVLLPPQTESERKFTVVVEAYADAPGAYPDIEVLATGAAFRDGWQMTHGERSTAGAILFEKKKWKECRETLAPLFERGTLHDAVAAAAARMLAYSAVELGENETVVRFFEVMKEKSPGEVVPFDKVRAVAKAYAAMNEHERSMQVWSGACDAYFLQEANVAGALEDLGRMKDSVAWMKTLLNDFPDTPLNREMTFGFGQRLHSKARTHRDTAEKNDKALTRAELLAECAAALEGVLARFPADPENDRAMLSLCSAYLEASKHDAGEYAARAAAKRFPKSRFLDTFDYTQAFALFAQRKFGESLALCDKLETFDYGAQANPGPAVIRTQAVLMKAQIFHAKGELDKALENYKKVKGESPDAARSIAFLEKEAIAIPDVTQAPLAKAAELELEYAGVAEAHVRAYKVDLTMLALRRRNLEGAASIEVAGIKPVFEKNFKLAHPNARRREKQTFTLDLKDPGAYLVGVKAGDFFASGLLLRSNLTMAVQEEAAGTVRVNISDLAAGTFAEGVKVTIFGTDEQRIASDKTDLRGIWETAGVRGLAVVVAEREGHVAMYRGQSELGRVPDPRKQPQEQEAAKKLEEQQKEVLEDELRRANDRFEDAYNRNLRNRQQGMEVERSKK